MENKTVRVGEPCPNCGLPRASALWRACSCGYDFGVEEARTVTHSPEADLPDDRTKYHTFWSRFFAGVLDGLVFFPIGFVDPYLSHPDRPLAVLVLWAVFSYSIYWLYSVTLHAKYGQTLGKRAVGIKVLDISEQRIPTLRQALLRDSGYIILNGLALAWFLYLVFTGQYRNELQAIEGPGLLLQYAASGWFLLEIVTMTMSSKRRAFHDLIAGTVVVRMGA